jgi:SAM-dependent methyltransferase
MDSKLIKSNLKKYYDQEAALRDLSEKEEWKKTQRSHFYNYIKAENKKTLLEIGAGTGSDSQYFMDCGLRVVAVDLSEVMVKICREKSIEAYEMDFYNLSALNMKFDCIWSMNSLLHVPKPDLPQVLNEINLVLKNKGLFYMGVYGGVDTESEYVNEITEAPRFFSYFSEQSLKDVLVGTFEIIEYRQMDVGRNTDFQAVVMRKK